MPPFGTYDFVQYWSAYQLLTAALDPYDAAATLALQCGQGLHCEFPRVTYTPPWLWIAMAPVLGQDLVTGANLWFRTSVLFIVASGFLVAWAYRLPVRQSWGAVLPLVFCLPAYVTMPLGQLAPLLLLGATMTMAGTIRNVQWLSGIGLFVFTVKPHLFVPLVVYLGMIWWQRSQLAALGYLGLCLTVGAAAAEWLRSGVTIAWLGHLLFPKVDQGVMAAVDWWTGAPASALARWVTNEGFQRPQWPMVVLPVAATVAALVLARRSRDSDGPGMLPAVIWLSVAGAPFAWVSDFLVAVVPVSAVISRFVALGRTAIAVALLLGAIAWSAVVFWTHPTFDDVQLWWYLAGPLAIWLIGQAVLSASSSAPAEPAPADTRPSRC